MSNIYAYNTLIILEGEYYIQYMVYIYIETKSILLFVLSVQTSCNRVIYYFGFIIFGSKGYNQKFYTILKHKIILLTTFLYLTRLECSKTTKKQENILIKLIYYFFKLVLFRF